MNNILIWWLILSFVSILNIICISGFIAFLKNKNNKLIYLLIFSFIYTIVCAIRAIWPRKDVEQTCLFDSKISTILIGRILATIAEISYIILILMVFTIITNDVNKIKKNKRNYIFILIKLVLLLIIIAQVFCWFGLITKYYMWNAFEESLWTISAFILLIISFIHYKSLQIKNKNKKVKSILSFCKVFIIISIMYIIFMCFIDVPMYYNRWKDSYNRNVNWNDFINDLKKYNKNLTIERFYNLNKCKKISRDIAEWKMEIPWLTGYFTFGVWSTYIIIIWYNDYRNLK